MMAFGSWVARTGSMDPPHDAEPSQSGQPKSSPDIPEGTMSTSSYMSPTSPMYMSPVERSNENRQGLRSPRANAVQEPVSGLMRNTLPCSSPALRLSPLSASPIEA